MTQHRVLAAMLLLAGCAVGPDFHRPAPPAVDGYTPEPLPLATAAADIPGGAAQRFVSDRDVPGEWWALFGSAPLNALIARALKANPDVEAAQAALRVAQENLAAQRGTYFPSIDANFSPSRQKNPTGSVAPTASSGAPIFSLYTAQVSISYVPDVFGGARRQVEALAAQGDAQRFQLEATYLTLTANVVAAAVQEASLRAQIAATQEIIDIESELLALLRRQSALGQIAQADVVAQQAALAQTQQSVFPLQKQLAQERDLLATLAGRFPSEAPDRAFRSCVAATAAGPAAERAGEARGAAAGRSGRRGKSACSERSDRRCRRQPAPQPHADRQRRQHSDAPRWAVHARQRLLERRREPDATDLCRRHLAASPARRRGRL